MNIYSASELRARFAELLSGVEEVELNLSEVNEFDSAGVQILLWFGREAGHRKVRCRVVEPSAVVEELVGLYNLKAAIGAVAGS
jgi:ABC-type transporter Mla MlaB component